MFQYECQTVINHFCVKVKLWSHVDRHVRMLCFCQGHSCYGNLFSASPDKEAVKGKQMEGN